MPVVQSSVGQFHIVTTVLTWETEMFDVNWSAWNLSSMLEIATPLRPQARAKRNRRTAAALSAELWRTGSQ